MTLPKRTRQNLKSSRGQIIVLFLLVLVVGLAIVLSVASRTVTDIRITTTSDESSRAYFAAEAAIEEALKKVSSSSVGDIFSLDFSSLNNSTATVEIKAGDSDTTFVYPTEIEKDGVAQIALMHPFSPPTQANLKAGTWVGGIPKSLTFFWVGPAAIEVSVVYATEVGGGDYVIAGPSSISKQIFDPLGRVSLCFGLPFAENFQTTGFSFDTDRRATLNISGSSETCTSLKQPSGTVKPVLARVRTLYNGSPLAVKGNYPLPPQGFTIDSSGQTPSGVTRRIEVTRLYPSVPSLFDYVLFSGGSDLKK